MKKENIEKKAGFTLVEVLTAFSISTLVVIAIFQVYLLTGKISHDYGKNAWAQSKVLTSSAKLQALFRNAARITDISADGSVVTFEYTDGSEATVSHVDIPDQNTGGIKYTKGSTEKWLVKEGAVNYFKNSSSEQVFSWIAVAGNIKSNALHVRYRMKQPTATAADEDKALNVDFKVNLRNYQP